MNSDFEKFMYLYYWGTVTEFNDTCNNCEALKQNLTITGILVFGLLSCNAGFALK